VGDEVVRGHLGCSNHEMIEFSTLGEVKREASKTCTMEFRKADFGLFIRWERVLKGKDVQ